MATKKIKNSQIPKLATWISGYQIIYDNNDIIKKFKQNKADYLAAWFI